MWIKLNLDGIYFNLQIKNYRPSNIQQWDEQWCKVSCSFVDEKYKIINYHTTDNELLLCSEIEGLAIEIEKLLDNRQAEKEVLEFIEPDFEIVLNSNLEIDYLSMEWKVYLWSDGLTTNYFATEFYIINLSHTKRPNLAFNDVRYGHQMKERFCKFE